MKNGTRTRSFRFFTKYSLFLLGISLWLAACSSNGDDPSALAKTWYQGFHALDDQAVLGLTCSSRLPEVQAALQSYAGTLSRYGSHDFDLSRLKFQTVDPGSDPAIVSVTGQETLVLDQQAVTNELKKSWQFVRESGLWKWCGEVPYVPPPSRFSGLTLWVVTFTIAIAVVFTLVWRSRQRRYSDYYTRSAEGILNRIQEYESGRVVSFNKAKGYGIVDDDQGHNYYIDYGSFVNQAYQGLETGERILFQSEWTPMGNRARNVIRVQGDTSSTNPHSRKLVILADRVKKLRRDYRFYKVGFLTRELNTCKSFFELLDLDIKRYNIRLMDHEVVLLYEVEQDLHDLSEEIQAMAYDSRPWVRILNLVLQVLYVVAEVIETVSPRTAELLRTVGRRTGRLLEHKKPPLLGPPGQM